MPPDDICRGRQRDQLLIGGLNVRGLIGKREVIKSLILSYQFDIFVITETKFSNANLEAKYELPGYFQYRCDRRSQGGGILIYYKRDLRRAIQVSPPICTETSHIQIAHISFPAPVNLDLIAVYNPPKANIVKKSKQNKMHPLSVELENVFERVQAGDGRVVLVGDINIHDSIDDDKRHKVITHITESKHRFTQVIQHETRVDVRHLKKSATKEDRYQVSSTLIDHIYLGGQLLNDVILSGVKRFGMSDHDVTYCNIKAPGFNPSRNHRQKSVAVREMEDVKLPFINYYLELWNQYNTLTYYLASIHRKWDVFRTDVCQERQRYCQRNFYEKMRCLEIADECSTCSIRQ